MYIRFSVRRYMEKNIYLFILFLYMLHPLGEISGLPFRENYVLLNNMNSFSNFCEVDQINFIHILK